MTVYKTTTALQASFPDGRAEELQDFFEKIWNDKAEYKVFMARRAFNLNYVMMKALRPDADQDYQTEHILSNTGLISISEQLATDYLIYGSFPRILICDDILIHGRTILRMIYDLKKAVWAFLSESGINIDQTEFQRSLTSSLEIFVFAKNEQGTLIDKEYEVKTETRMKLYQLRGLSQQISAYLQNCGIANTSFVLSSDLLARQRQELFNNYNVITPSLSFCYRGRRQLVYYRNRSGILETVRVHCPDEYSMYEGVVTSLAIIGKIKKKDLDRISSDMAFWLKYYASDGQIYRILNYTDSSMDQVKLKLLLFLLSIFGFVDFFKIYFRFGANQIFQMLITSDYIKIASNFGLASELKNELGDLFRALSFQNLTTDWIFEELSLCGAMAPDAENVPETGQFEQARLGVTESKAYFYAEDIFYAVGGKAEIAANKCVKGETVYDPGHYPSSDSFAIEEYLKQMTQRGIFQDTSSIGCALGLMDSGLMALNVEPLTSDNEDTDREIEMFLKAGELAVSVYIRRFSIFIPALAFIEKQMTVKKDELEKILENFIRYLQDLCYTRYGRKDKRDEDLLKALNKEAEKAEQKEQGLFSLYQLGQKFQDWNTDLIVEGDRTQIPGNKSENHFSEKEEKLRKEYYLLCADAYISADY